MNFNVLLTVHPSRLFACVLKGHLMTVLTPEAIPVQFWPPEDERKYAQNMYRHIIDVLK
jgi:hypothetical protein